MGRSRKPLWPFWPPRVRIPPSPPMNLFPSGLLHPMKKKFTVLIFVAAVGVIFLGVGAYLFLVKGVFLPGAALEYRNTQYGFSFSLPASWKGYSIVMDQWQGYISGQLGDELAQQGPLISIRHPLWTSANPRQDIPVMVFTFAQWDSLQRNEFHIGAAPIGPSELGRNTQSVFALPARYNFAFPAGWEEVQKILEDHALRAF